MRKVLAVLVFMVVAYIGIAALSTDVYAKRKCPKKMRPVNCPYGILCCPPGDPVLCSCF